MDLTVMENNFKFNTSSELIEDIRLSLRVHCLIGNFVRILLCASGFFFRNLLDSLTGDGQLLELTSENALVQVKVEGRAIF